MFTGRQSGTHTKGRIGWEGEMGLRTEAIFLQRLHVQQLLEIGPDEEDMAVAF